MDLKRIAMMGCVVWTMAACAHKPPQNVPPQQGASPVPSAKVESNYQTLPNVELTDQILYEILLGDVAAQRGRPDVAAQIYLTAAKSTRDPRLAAQAARLAYEARQIEKSREAFALWQALEPKSMQARQGLATILLSGGKLEEARTQLVELLATDAANNGEVFLQIYPLLARYPDKAAIYTLVHDLAKPYPKVSEAQWALAQAADAVGKNEIALQAAHQARILRPSWDGATMLEAQFLLRDKPQQGVALVEKYLTDYPESREMRLFYARVLTGQKRYAAARAEFQKLLVDFPDSADLAFAVALLSLEMGELDRAEQELKQSLANGKKDSNGIYYYLAQLSEAKKQDAEALENYRKVQTGEYAFPANLKVAYLLNKLGKQEEARQHLRAMSVENNQQRVQVILIETQWLREAKQYEEAFQVLSQSLKKMPDHPELLYEAGMVASLMGRRDTFEQMMRKLIQLKPDHAQAYNALGYDFLDRNERVQEGMQLVEKAYALTPDDAAITDSMGWGYYRLGDLAKSLEFLRRAYAGNPDPEIAAHLGEVLWVQGKKDEAQNIWQQALKDYPDNKVLLSVIKKFQP